MTGQMPAEYAAILAGAIALYGSLSVVATHALRQFFPAEGNSARIIVAVISGLLGLIAAAQVGLSTLPSLPPEQRLLGILGLVAGTWWASQEIYRRLRVDTWGTAANPKPQG